MGTGRDAVSGRVIGKRPPEGAIGDTLPGAILPEGVVGAPEDAGASCVLGVCPRIGRTSEDTSFGRIISESAIVCDITSDNLGVGTDSNTGLGEHVSIGEDIPGAEPDTPARVIVCELHAQRCILSTGRLALASHVARPSADRTRIGAVVAHRGSHRTGRHAGVSDVISEEVRQGGTHRHASVGRIVSVLPFLPVAVRHAATLPRVSVLQLRTPEHTQPAAILREERRDAEIHAGPCPLEAESINNCEVDLGPSGTAGNTGLGLVVGEEAAGTEHKALSGGIGGIVEERDVASQLAHPGRIVRKDPRSGIVGTVGHAFASSRRIIRVVFRYRWTDSNAGES